MSVALPGDGAIVATVVVNGAEQQIVQVSNLPATQTVTGTVALDAAALAAIASAATPATQAVSIAASVSVTGPVTDTQLRLSPVPVSGAFFQATQPVSGSFFQATQPISGAVSVSNMVAQGLTDTQLRLTALPVSGAFFQATQPVSGPATDVQLRATPLPVSMSNTLALTDTQLRATPVPVTMSNTLALTDAQLRASAIPTLEIATVIVGQSAQTAVINNIIDAAASANATDASNLRAAVVQVVSTGTGGTFIFEQSNDNVNFRPLPVFNSELTTAVPIVTAVTATASQIIYTFPIRGRFVRLRIVSLITGGSIQAFSRLSSDPWTPTAALVASPTAANLQVTASGTMTANQGTANAAPWLANPLTSQITAEASSAKTVTGNTASAITNPSATGVMLFLNASVVTGTTPSLTVRVQVQDPVSAAWVDLPGASFAAITAVTAAPLLLAIDLGLVAVANAAVNMALPRTWRLAWVISGTTPSFTFSVGAQYLL